MSLVLPYRWEHALVAATVAASAKQAPSGCLGRTAVQKLLYFMKVLGIPMNYRFDIHHYGPFCSSIMADVDWLLVDDVIEDKSAEPRYSNYKPGNSWPELEEQFREQLDEHRQILNNVCEALSDMQPEILEVLATLDYSYRWVRASGGEGPWREPTIERFKQIKKDKFTRDQIDRCYDSLLKARVIEN